jgi:hypothetical protein
VRRAKKLKGYTIEHLAGQFKEIFRNKLTKHLDLIIRRDCMKKQGEKLENDNWVNDIIHSKIGGYQFQEIDGTTPVKEYEEHDFVWDD